MKRFVKLISCGVTAAALIFSAQLCAMAAITNDNPASSHVPQNTANAVSGVQNETVSGVHDQTASGAYNQTVSGVQNDIAPYGGTGTPNPQTGTQSLVIPGVVAMLAAATAAVTLAGKKK